MIYLDNNATTQPSTKVIGAMLYYMQECYSNASALTAQFTGADHPRRDAATSLAKLFHAEDPSCFIFTSGATESNNWLFSSLAKERKAGRVLISTIEHASVAEPAAELARLGFEVIEIPVDSQGIIQLSVLRTALDKGAALVSIMAANNETGVLQPLAAIGKLIRAHCPAALFHSDATQAIGKVTIDLQSEWETVDLLSFSAHKFHGPKGIGGIYIRPGIELPPMLLGGGQENSLRSGTTNTPALAGLAIAASEASGPTNNSLQELRDLFESELEAKISGITIYSRSVPRLPNTSFFSLPATPGEEAAAILAAAGIIVGTGAACSAGAIHSSKTLRAMKIPYDAADRAVRVSLSRFTTQQEMRELISQLETNF